MSEKLKRILLNSIYVAGINFFSALSLAYTDSLLSLQELQHASITSFIAFGMTFFTLFGAVFKLRGRRGEYKARRKLNKFLVI